MIFASCWCWCCFFCYINMCKIVHTFRSLGYREHVVCVCVSWSTSHRFSISQTTRAHTTFPFSAQRFFSSLHSMRIFLLCVVYESCQYLLEKLLHWNHILVLTYQTPESVALFHFFLCPSLRYFTEGCENIWINPEPYRAQIRRVCTWLTISFPMIIHLELESTHLNQTRSPWLSFHLKLVVMRCLHHIRKHTHTHTSLTHSNSIYT